MCEKSRGKLDKEKNCGDLLKILARTFDTLPQYLLLANQKNVDLVITN